jgi:DNA-binding beta-propeller fold protein YncE
MAVYDLNTLALITTVSSGLNWWGVAVNPVTDRIYLTILPGRGLGARRCDPYTCGWRRSRSVSAEGRFGITVDTGANFVYVARYAATGKVLAINGVTNVVTRVEAAGSFPYALALDAAHGRLYTADINSGTVSVLSTEGPLTWLSTIVVGGTPTGGALPTLGPSRLYVTNSLLGEVDGDPVERECGHLAVISATIAPTSTGHQRCSDRDRRRAGSGR